MPSDNDGIADAVASAGDGSLIVAGAGRRIEVLRPDTGNVAVAAGSVGREWFYATSTALPDDRVLIAGGYDDAIDPTAAAWIYRPAGFPNTPVTSRATAHHVSGTARVPATDGWR